MAEHAITILDSFLLFRRSVPVITTNSVRALCRNRGWLNGRYHLESFFRPELQPLDSVAFSRLMKRYEWLNVLLSNAERNDGVVSDNLFRKTLPRSLTYQYKAHPENAVYSGFELFLWFWTAEKNSDLVLVLDGDVYYPRHVSSYVRSEKGLIYYARCRDESLKKKARQQLLAKYLPLVRNVATHMAMGFPRSVQLADIIHTGTVGLIQAFDNFDASRGVGFPMYAVPRIRGAILDEARAADWVPRSVRSKQREFDAAMLRLSYELTGKFTPHLNRVAEAIGLSPRELSHHLFDVQRGAILSLDEIVYPEDDNRQVPRIETVASDLVEPTEWIHHSEVMAKIVEFMPRLTAQQVMVLRMYYWEERRLREMGEIMNVSESRVSKIHTKAISRLRQMLCDYFGISYVRQSNGRVTCIDASHPEVQNSKYDPIKKYRTINRRCH